MKVSSWEIVQSVALISIIGTCTTNAFVFPKSSKSGLTWNQGNKISNNHFTKSPTAATPRSAVKTQLSSSLARTISQLSNPASLFTQLTSSVQATPAIAYFLALFVAGFGVPVSEDLLCIFAGTMLPLDKIQSPARRLRLIAALYLGVVISDLITFSIGRMMKVGLLEPLRKRMNLGEKPSCDKEGVVRSTGSSQSSGIEGSDGQVKLGKRQRALQKLESVGDWAGFYARMSVGFRPAMMMLSGFSGKVSFVKYALGTAVGAVISLAAQLLLGYSMRRHKPSDILALLSKLLVVVPAVLISGITVFLVRQGNSTNDPSQSSTTQTVGAEDAINNQTSTAKVP